MMDLKQACSRICFKASQAKKRNMHMPFPARKLLFIITECEIKTIDYISEIWFKHQCDE